jgi:TonB family protein
MNFLSLKIKRMPRYLKMLALSILTLLLVSFSAQAQHGNSDASIFTAVEKAAEFPGGITQLSKYLKASLKYPAEALKNKVEGKVFLTFVVEKDGSLTNIKVLHGIGSGTDAEAVRVIKASPKWKPGKQDGKVVRQQYTVPIAFVLPGNEIYIEVEHSAEFPGGMKTFYRFLAKNIKYPATGVEGNAYLTFVVEKDGSLSNFKVLREPGAGLGNEAIRVMKLSPKWKPGTQNGIAVRQQYTVPVNFSLKVK